MKYFFVTFCCFFATCASWRGTDRPEHTSESSDYAWEDYQTALKTRMPWSLLPHSYRATGQMHWEDIGGDVTLLDDVILLRYENSWRFRAKKLGQVAIDICYVDNTLYWSGAIDPPSANAFNSLDLSEAADINAWQVLEQNERYVSLLLADESDTVLIWDKQHGTVTEVLTPYANGTLAWATFNAWDSPCPYLMACVFPEDGTLSLRLDSWQPLTHAPPPRAFQPAPRATAFPLTATHP